MNTTKRLPDKPSALIRLALEDLKKVEQLPEYHVDMEYWHTYNIQTIAPGKCTVCLGGAVIAQEFDAPVDEDIYPGGWSIDEDSEQKIRALDQFRKGAILDGFDEMKLVYDEESLIANFGYLPICPYRTNKEGFYKDMESLAKDLEEHGF